MHTLAREISIRIRSKDFMRKKRQRKRFFFFMLCTIGVAAILVGILFATVLRSPRQEASAAGPGYIGSRHGSSWYAQRGMDVGITPMRPMYSMAKRMVEQATAATLPCLNSTALPRCYSPQQIRQAYGVRPLINNGITGKGRIITIIDAFQDPTVRQDLHVFDQVFGLNDPTLNIITPFGVNAFNAKDPAQVGFAGEIALDVEWAHAIAPGATIDLVLAHVQNETARGEIDALLQATGYAVNNSLGSVISQSFGVGEGCLTAASLQSFHQIFQQARAQGQTVFAAAGDSGAAAVVCNANGVATTVEQGVNYPASDPLVTSVGGTTLLATSTGAYISETAWNESQQGDGATGGGVSKVFALPTFQQNIVNSQARAVDDIALDADPLTGVPVVTSSFMSGGTMIVPFGGTSIGSPIAAGMTALFDQAAGGKRLGFLNAALYRISQNAIAYEQAFHDVTAGSNTFIFKQSTGNKTTITKIANQTSTNDTGKTFTIAGFQAGNGWDAPTGLGSPNAAALANLLPQFMQAGDGAGL
jgi:subtilase family serine protease